MAIDEDVQQKLLAHINAKWKGGCSMCGSKAWEAAGFTTSLVVSESIPKGIRSNGPVLPSAVLVCSNCGNTVLVNVIVAGLAPPQDG